MFATLLADSGGADEIVDTIVGFVPPHPGPLTAINLLGATWG
jgi:H+/gluconate symporter-like permease